MPEQEQHRPPDLRVVEAVREAVRAARARGLIPTEIRLDQERWNGLSPQMRFEPFGKRKALLFEGLPCVLVVRMKRPEGFVVHTLEPPD